MAAEKHVASDCLGDLYGNRFTIVPIVGQEGEGMGRRNNVGNSRSLQDKMELSLHGYILIIFISIFFFSLFQMVRLTHFKLCNEKTSETGELKRFLKIMGCIYIFFYILNRDNTFLLLLIIIIKKMYNHLIEWISAMPLKFLRVCCGRMKMHNISM